MISFKSKIGNGKVIDKIVGFPLSIYNPKAPLVKDRVLLTGDAAGTHVLSAMQNNAKQRLTSCLLVPIRAGRLTVPPIKVRTVSWFQLYAVVCEV